MKKAGDLNEKLTAWFPDAQVNIMNYPPKKNRFQSVPIASLRLYNVERENLVLKKSLCIKILVTQDFKMTTQYIFHNNSAYFSHFF